MNTKEQLEAQVKVLENKLSEMKATINKMEKEKKSFKRWRGQDSTYYSINISGGIYEGYDIYDEIDNARYSMGNYYKTREEAERARDLQLAIVRVNDAIDEANEGWIADYSCSNPKFIIYYSYSSYKYMFDAYCNLDFSYKLKECKTKEIAERIIKDFTSDLNLIFNVK